jgi:hypothetical protein
LVTSTAHRPRSLGQGQWRTSVDVVRGENPVDVDREKNEGRSRGGRQDDRPLGLLEIDGERLAVSYGADLR